MKEKEEQKQVNEQVSVWMPRELRNLIQESAKKEYRTFSADIVKRLTESFRKEK